MKVTGRERNVVSHRRTLQWLHSATTVVVSLLLVLSLAGAAVAQSEEAAKPAPSSHVRMYQFQLKHGQDKQTGTRVGNATAPPAGAQLTYYGGRVVSNMQVVQVLWGPGSYLSNVGSTGTPSMATFFQQSLNSAYVDWLDHDYNTVNPSPRVGTAKTNQHIGRGSFVNQYTITPSITGSTIDDTQIQAEISRQITAGHLPVPTTDAAGNNNTYYAVFFPPGITITQGGSSSCVSGGFCAYHGTIPAGGGIGELYYGVHPDMQPGSGCATGCGTSTTFGNYTAVASHEMVETITDAEVGIATVIGPPLAWYDSTNGEIGDICNAQQGSFVGGDGQTYVVQKEWSNSQNACILQTTATNDFSIGASPSAVSIAAGSSGSSTISTATTSGSAQTVSLSVSGAPSGVTATVSPTSVTSGGSSTLSISATSSAAAGTYTLTITGTAASGTHTTTVSLTITSTTTPDFTISANPTSMSFTQGTGGSGNSTIATAAVGGSGTVSLTTSVNPAGPTAAINPTSVTAGNSATLTVTVGVTVAAGTYTVTVTGTEGTKTHSATVTVTVNSGNGGGLTNGGFETGNFSGWTTSGASDTVVNSGCHGGTYCARLGSTAPTNGDSTITQTFTAPTGTTGISLWYKMTCPDTVTYDWATVTLKDNTSATTATLLAKTCTTNAWTNLAGSVTAGHSYTLTLTSHDDNYSGDATYTLYDDVTLTTSSGGGITNGGFESGATGWTTAGTTAIATSGCHGGTGCARAGSTAPTNGDSSFTQTFTVPSGKTQLSFWYKTTCPDTVTYDWTTATLNGTTIVTKTCTNNGTWVNKTVGVTAGATYTLVLISHDDNYAGDATYTLFDDVILQ